MDEIDFTQKTRSLQSISRNPNTQWVWTKQAIARLAGLAVSVADVEAAMGIGTVEAEDTTKKKERWRVRGTTQDGMQIDVVLEASEQKQTIHVMTVHIPDVLEEVTTGAITPQHIERRIQNWTSRIDELYERIARWVPKGWHADHNHSIQMHEQLMQRYQVAARNLPVLTLTLDDTVKARIEPRGLWIIGANGRLDFFRNGAQYVITDAARPFLEPKWQIASARNRSKLQPLDRRSFLAALK